MIPIRETSGAVVGFGGRVLPTAVPSENVIAGRKSAIKRYNATATKFNFSHKVAKYVNSPSTAGKCLFLSNLYFLF
jgi:hypothetical protein